jgi:RNA polymerase sigma factor (sigma-70 family)
MIMADNGVLSQGTVSGDDRRAYVALLVDRAREGQMDAAAELVTELSPMLWHVARAAGLGLADAEDVVQTVWLRLMSKLDTIRTPAALTSWLVITARHEAWHVRAAARRQQPADSEWLMSIPDTGLGAEENVILREEHRQLHGALRGLSERCQELLRIVAFVPRPDYDSVAAKLGMPRGSVGPTRSRCLDKLRSALNGEGDQG